MAARWGRQGTTGIPDRLTALGTATLEAPLKRLGSFDRTGLPRLGGKIE